MPGCRVCETTISEIGDDHSSLVSTVTGYRDALRAKGFVASEVFDGTVWPLGWDPSFEPTGADAAGVRGVSVGCDGGRTGKGMHTSSEELGNSSRGVVEET